VKAHYQKNYILKIIITDLNRKHDCTSYIAINKNDKNQRQNFLILNSDSTVFFKNYISKDQQIKVQFNDKSKKIIFVKHYAHLPYIATPPYSANIDKQTTYSSDSIFSMPLHNGQTSFFKLPKHGICQFLVDTSQEDGLSVYRFYNDFPAVTTPEHMLSCLRYLTSRTEFEKMNLVKDKKQSVDDFWMENGGNPNKAKELVKRFYTRVEEANRYFTSYVEGWKTDRGMIYIVYGLPNVVYRSEFSEVWIYGEPNHILSIYYTFSFENKSPFTDNSFILSRSSAYKENWFRTLSSWRK
jgi:GWxTD domain-containing protein